MSLETLKPKVAELIEKAQNSGNTDELEAIIDNSGVLDSTEGTVEEKVEQVVDKAKAESLWYNHFKKHGYTYSSSWGFFQDYEYATLPKIDVSTFKRMSYFCAYSKVERIDFYLNSEAATTHKNCFYQTPLLTFVKGVNTSNSTDVSGFFADSTIEVVEMPFDFSKATNASNFTNSCYTLREIRFVPETIKVSISFSNPSLLTAESRQSIFDGLATVETAQTLTLNANLKILQSQVDSANAKGWTVAGGTVVSEEEYYG